ncbi:MAG: glycoside hydrolase family 28 protein [Kineosporiaceae bacterium]
MTTVRTATGLVEVAPPVPGAVRSQAFAVTVEDVAVPVEDWRDLSFARVALAGVVRVVVERAAGGEAAWRVRPRPPGPGAAPGGRGRVLRFTLDRPGTWVVDADRGRRLVLFAEAPESGAPDPADPGVVDVRRHGAVGDGAGVETEALQRALDSVAAAGGGVLHLPPGIYRTGTLRLRSRVTLHVAAGALLQGTGDPADHPVDPGRTEGPATYGEHFTHSRLIHLDGVHDAGIVGRGVVDGDGVRLRAAGRTSNLVRVSRSHDVTIRDVVLRDSAAWNTHVLDSTRVRVEGVRILNDASLLNTDGIDIDSSSEVLVDRLFVHAGDDAVCVKATRNGDPGGRSPAGDVRRVLVRDGVYLTRCAALKVGTESNAELVSDVRFIDNTVLDSDRAMSLVMRDGGAYARIGFKGVLVDGVDHLVEQAVQLRAGYDRRPGRMTGLTFRDVVAPDYHPRDNRTSYNPAGGPVLSGYDAQYPLVGVRFAGVVVNGHRLADAAGAWEHARIDLGLHVHDVRFEP